MGHHQPLSTAPRIGPSLSDPSVQSVVWDHVNGELAPGVPIKVAVSGHLHMRATDWRDGVRFEEVSIGYPDHWIQSKGIVNYLREILPGPAEKVLENAGPFWHR